MLQQNCNRPGRTANSNTIKMVKNLPKTGQGERKLHMLSNTYGMRLGQRGEVSPSANLLYAGYPKRYDNA